MLTLLKLVDKGRLNKLEACVTSDDAKANGDLARKVWMWHEGPPLHYAVAMGNAEAAHILIEAGLDVDSYEILRDKSRLTPLATAIIYKQLACAQTLLKLGAKAKKDSYLGKDKLNATPLHLAAMEGADELVKPIIDVGVDINELATWHEGQKCSALHLAVLERDTEMVKALLFHGANPYVYGTHGSKEFLYGTPLDWCILSGVEADHVIFTLLHKARKSRWP